MVYREDALGDDDWSALTTRLDPVRPVPPAAAVPTETLHNEMLASILERNTVFSCRVPTELVAHDGHAEQAMRDVIFRVIDVAYSRSRPELIHTFLSAEDLVLACPLAVNVQHYDIWATTEDEHTAGQLVVYTESDPEWVQPARLAPTQVLQQSLLRYDCVTTLDTQPGVLVLSRPRNAVPVHALTDERCPLLVLAQELVRRGWTATKAMVRHTAISADEFDSRNSTRMRWYYRVLLQDVRTCVTLAGGSMPSQEPMAFYRLLLAGVRVLPGRPATEYQALLNNHRKNEDRT